MEKSGSKEFNSSWKKKAIERQLEIKDLKQAVKRNKNSADSWRIRSNHKTETIKDLQAQIKILNAELKKN